MSTLYTLLEQARQLRAKLEQDQHIDDRVGRVVVYDSETRQPLPGYEPNPHPDAVNIWLPYDGRDALPEPSPDAEVNVWLPDYTQSPLVAEFLALDENSMPDFSEAPIVVLQGVSYHLYRTAFRALRQSIVYAKSTRGINTDDLECCRMWVETYRKEE